MWSHEASRRGFLRAAMAAGATGFVAACGGAKHESSSGGATPAPAAAEGGAVGLPRGLTGSITVSYPDELGRKPPYVDRAAGLVMQAYPGAEVRVDHQQLGEGEYYAKLLPLLQAGGGPDVLHVGGDRIGELAEAGLVAPLDAYTRSWPDWRYYPPTVIEGVSYQGKVWAVPYGLDTRFLYYRRDLFARAGLPAAWRPRSVLEILDAAAAVKAKVRDVIPYALYAGQAGDSGTANHGFLPLLYAFGGELQDKSGYWIGDSPAVRKALAYYARAYRTDRLAPPELLTMTKPWVAMRERLGEGSLALLFEGGWVYGGWATKDRAATEKNIGYMLFPSEHDGPSFTIGGPGTCWFINAASPNKDLAWAFIATWNSADTVGHLNAEDPHPVARVDAVRVPDYQSQRFLIDSTDSLKQAHFTPVNPDYTKVIGAIQSATGRVAGGEMSPEDAAARYADDLRQLVGAAKVITQT